MSAVVLRCPNCGTTKAAPGECEACHESQVRYYCTNHTPGRWLDAASCQACGARFGEPMSAPARPAPAAPPRPAARPGPAAPGRRPASTSRTGPRPVPPPAGRPAAGEGSGPGPGRVPPAEEEGIDMRGGYAPVGPTWQDLFRAAARARRARPDAVFDHEAAPPVRPRRGGCLGRLMLILVFMFLAFMGGVSLLGGSVLRLFLPF
jgi:hypothetical protein